MFENVFISAWKKQLKMEEQNDMDIEAGDKGAEKRSLKDQTVFEATSFAH